MDQVPGRHVGFREGLETGGRPLGWMLAVAGVLMWVIWDAPKDGTPSPWPAVRWAVTALIALAWTVPTFVVPVPAAARAWRWAAALTVLAAALTSLPALLRAP